MIKAITISTICLILFSSLLQAKTQQEVEQLLASQSVVRGQFEQLRTMEIFSQPLRSTGHFVVHKQNGLLWQQTLPFQVNLVLTDDKLSQQFASQPAQVMTAKENPMAFYFSHIFLSLFDGDTQQINEQFSQKYSYTADEWELILSPKQAPLNAVFSRIIINGNRYINQIELTEIRGDKTTINFSQQSEQPTHLTAEESAHFQF